MKPFSGTVFRSHNSEQIILILLIILGLLQLFDSCKASDINDLESITSSFSREYRRVKNTLVLGDSQLNSLEQLGWDICEWIANRHSLCAILLEQEQKFITRNEGYEAWLYEKEINVQGFKADIEHYSECLNFASNRCITSLKLHDFIEDIHQGQGQQWCRKWLLASPNYDVVSVALKVFLEDQKKLENEYLLPILSNQKEAHERWENTR